MDENIVVALVLTLICVYSTLRCRHHIISEAIPKPENAPWSVLLNQGDDCSFLELTGFDRASFYELHNILFADEQPQRTGRPKTLNNYAELGLLLHFLNSTMKIKSLCQIFGAVPSVINRSITKMLRLTVNKLKNHPKSRVRWPSEDAMASSSATASYTKRTSSS